MTARMTLPTLPDLPGNPPIGDDSATTVAYVSDGKGPATVLTSPDHSRWEWTIDGPMVHARQPALLRFRVFYKDGKPVSDLEPYMGMAGHLVIVKRDLAVFAHVHPSGSMLMAALMLLERQKNSGNSAMSAMPGMHDTALPAEVTFPYGFPETGDYRLFVQIKRSGQDQTASFDARVDP